MPANSPSPAHAPATVFRRQEIVRWLVLLAAGFWLFHPFLTGRQIGTGDALWYANMLADYVTQLRAGVFPIFVGQTEYAFNGAVYPLRVAPLYQHLAGAIDLLTGRQLGFFALQHATVIVCGFAGLFASYFTLGRLVPRQRWTACGLSILYVSCPGVLGTIYTQDLYMTWMTVPFLPFAVYGIVRSFQHDDLLAQVCLAAALAGLWLGHSPIALWMTLIAGGLQAVRLVVFHRNRPAWTRALAGGVLFVALGLYPFVSVGSLNSPGVASAVSTGLAQQERITNVIREVFPAVLLPLSDHARTLGDLQLGYGFWLILVVSLHVACRVSRWELRLLLVAGLVLLVLLLPVPLLNDWLWLHLPEQIKRITFYWPMHRFYLILAALLATAGQLALAVLTVKKEDERTQSLSRPTLCRGFTLVRTEDIRPGAGRRTNPGSPAGDIRAYRVGSSAAAKAAGLIPGTQQCATGSQQRYILTFTLTLACIWSLWESRQFIRAGHERTASAERSTQVMRPENRLLMNHAYGLFPALPAYFSNGVLDPRSEARLLSPATFQPIPASARDSAFNGEFLGTVDDNPGVLKLGPTLQIKPGRRYALDFEFGPHRYAGVLQLSGRTFIREYLLPQSGEPQAFGTTPANSHSLSLWTTTPDPETITLRYIPTDGAKPVEFADFARFQLREIDPIAKPVVLNSLLPFRATVHPEHIAWLETPRMFIPGYIATTDGRPAEVRRSPQGLVMVEVTSTTHDVEVRYVGPVILRAAYWLSLAAWIALLVSALVWTSRRVIVLRSRF